MHMCIILIVLFMMDFYLIDQPSAVFYEIFDSQEAFK